MKITYIHQYFKTPKEGGAIRSYYLAKALVTAGHEVCVITAHNARELRLEQIEGIHVTYLPVYYGNHLGKWLRVWAFLKFVWKAFWKAYSQETEVYYVSSTPLTVGCIALLLKGVTRKPYYFEARDLWPEVPIALGVIRGRLSKYVLRLLEKYSYQQATQLIALSPGIQQGMQQGVPNRTIHLIPNMADCSFFQPRAYQAKKVFQHAGKTYDLGEGYLVGYFGALGKANALHQLIEIAAWCQKNAEESIQFCIVGEGAEKEALKRQALSLRNMHVLDGMPKAGIREILSLTDINYVSFLPHPVLETTSPNKFFDGLAAGKLTVVNVNGWLRELVETNGCGFYADPAFPAQFYEKLSLYLRDSALFSASQKNARLLAVSQFSRQLLEAQFLQLFAV